MDAAFALDRHAGVAEFKAREFLARRHPDLYRECPPVINWLSGKLVICPKLERVFPPRPAELRVDPSHEKPLPSIFTQARNLAVAGAKHVASGGARACDEVREERRALCNGCDLYRPSDDRCGACGCHLEEKISWATSSCPRGLWLAEGVRVTKAGGCGCSKGKGRP